MDTNMYNDSDCSDQETDDPSHAFRVTYAMDLSSSLPPQSSPGIPDSYVDALSTLQGAKSLLLSTTDARKGLKQLQEKNDELLQSMEDQSNIQVLNDIQQMRQFYDEVTTGSARVDARIRAIESVQWLDLDDKYGIRRSHLLGESRNMKAIEEKAMRDNSMAALRHYLGEFQVKRIRNQLESADAWFGAQEKRLKEEVLQVAGDAQQWELIEAALQHENVDPNLSNVFAQRGQSLSEASARIYQSFAVWAGRAKKQLEETKLESAAAAKHMKNRLLSTEAEASYLRARVAELEASVASSGADEAGIKADIQAKYISTQKSLQEQISQLRDQICDVQESTGQDRDEIAGAKRMAASLKNYDPDRPSEDGGSGIDDRESLFKEYMRQLTTKDNAINERLQRQIDQKLESLSALGTAEAEAKARIAAAQGRSRQSVIALDKHRMKMAADRNALEIMFKALSGKKESLDKKIARAEERAAGKMRSAQIKDKNSAVLKALSDGNRKTVHAGSSGRAGAGHRSTTIAKAPVSNNNRHHRMTAHAPNSSIGRGSVVHSTKNSLLSSRKKSKGALFPDDGSEDSSLPRKNSFSRPQQSARRRSSLGGEAPQLIARRKSSVSSVTGLLEGEGGDGSQDLTASMPLSARKSSFTRRNSKDLRRASHDLSPRPHPPIESRDHTASLGRPPRIARAHTTVSASTDNPASDDKLSGSGGPRPKPNLFVDIHNAESGTAVADMDVANGAVDSGMEAIAEYEDPEPEEDEPPEPFQMCGRSGSTLLAAMLTFFIVDRRLVKIEKQAPAVEVPEPEMPAVQYNKKFDHVKEALPKDIYYRNKRRAAPMRRRMFSSDDAEDELLVENPIVKYLVIDENYNMTFDFSEALVAVNRLMSQLQSLGYLDAPTPSSHALCNMFNYFNVGFLLEDFKLPEYVISRPVYAFAADGSAKLWRRYQESLQAIRYQDNFQREDELRRLCITIIKYSVDTFINIVGIEQKYFRSEYSLTVQDTDVNVWLRMAEVLSPIYAALGVIVNSTYETENNRLHSEDEQDADGLATAEEIQVVPPPPSECALGPSMLVFLNHASEHIYSSICLANGKSGKEEAAHYIPNKSANGSLEVSVDSPIRHGQEDSSQFYGDSTKTYKVQGEVYYPLSFVHTTGFFFTLCRAAFMTSMVSQSTRSPFYGLLNDWLQTHYPNHWKEAQWKPGTSKAHMRKQLLRDIQIMRAFSGYFYYTGLGEEMMDLEQAEKKFKAELVGLISHNDIFGGIGAISTTPVEGAPDAAQLDSPIKASRLSTINKGGVSCHELALLNLLGAVVPPALPVLAVLRMILKLAFRQIKALGVTMIDADESREDCIRMASERSPRNNTFTELEDIVLERPLPMAQRSTYGQLESLAAELLGLVETQVDMYEDKLRSRQHTLERLDSVLEEEEALGIERSEVPPAPQLIDPAAAVSITNAVNGEPFIRDGERMILELSYDHAKRLESILSEVKDLSHTVARGTKVLSTMVTLRFQTLLEALSQLTGAMKVHRKRADAWAAKQKQSIDLHGLIASNRRSIIGVCEAMLDACGVSMDGAVVSHQLSQAEIGCERIKSARRRLRFAVEAAPSNATPGASETNDTVAELAGGDQLEAIKESITALRSQANPSIRQKLLRTNEKSAGVSGGNYIGPVDSSGDEMERFKQYLMEQMSAALVHTSHWKSEWDELVDEERTKARRNEDLSPDRERTGADATLSQHLHAGYGSKYHQKDSDIRLSDLLGVPPTPTGVDVGQSTEQSSGEGSTSEMERGVVPGMQWRLTRGVLRTGEDVLAGSSVR